MIEYVGSWNNKKITVYVSMDIIKSEFLGYLVVIGDKLEHLISIEHPRGCSMSRRYGILTFWGRDKIIRLSLKDGEIEEEKVIK